MTWIGKTWNCFGQRHHSWIVHHIFVFLQIIWCRGFQQNLWRDLFHEIHWNPKTRSENMDGKSHTNESVCCGASICLGRFDQSGKVALLFVIVCHRNNKRLSSRCISTTTTTENSNRNAPSLLTFSGSIKTETFKLNSTPFSQNNFSTQVISFLVFESWKNKRIVHICRYIHTYMHTCIHQVRTVLLGLGHAGSSPVHSLLLFWKSVLFGPMTQSSCQVCLLSLQGIVLVLFCFDHWPCRFFNRSRKGIFSTLHRVRQKKVGTKMESDFQKPTDWHCSWRPCRHRRWHSGHIRFFFSFLFFLFHINTKKKQTGSTKATEQAVIELGGEVVARVVVSDVPAERQVTSNGRFFWDASFFFFYVTECKREPKGTMGQCSDSSHIQHEQNNHSLWYPSTPFSFDSKTNVRHTYDVCFFCTRFFFLTAKEKKKIRMTMKMRSKVICMEMKRTVRATKSKLQQLKKKTLAPKCWHYRPRLLWHLLRDPSSCLQASFCFNIQSVLDLYFAQLSFFFICRNMPSHIGKQHCKTFGCSTFWCYNGHICSTTCCFTLFFFQNGETRVEIKDSCRACDAFVIQPICTSHVTMWKLFAHVSTTGWIQKRERHFDGNTSHDFGASWSVRQPCDGRFAHLWIRQTGCFFAIA